MKRRKTGAVLLLMIFAGCFLAGCTGSGKKATAESVLNGMKAAIQKNAVISSHWTLEVTGMVPSEGIEDIPFSLTAEGKTSRDRKKGNSDTEAAVDIAYNGTEEPMEIRCFTEETGTDQAAVYVLMQDQWYRKIGAAAGEDPRFPDWSLLKDVLKLSEETQTVGGVPCRLLEGEIPPEMTEPWTAAWKRWLGTELDGLEGVPGRARLLVREADSLPQRAEIVLQDSGGTEGKPRFTDISLIWTLADEKTDPQSVQAEAEGDAVAVSSVDELAISWRSKLEAEEYLGSETSMWDRLPSPVLVREFLEDEEAGLLYSGDAAEIRVTRVYTAQNGAAYVDLAISNRSGKTMEIFSNRAAMNHIMSDAGLNLSAEAGETVAACLYFPEMAEAASAPALLTVDLEGYALPQYNTVFRTGQTELPIAEDIPEAALKEGGEIVYEDNWIRAVAYPADTSDEHVTVIPLGILNKSAASLSISSGPVTISGKGADGYVYAEILSGYACYTSFSFGTSALKKAGVEKVADIRLTLDLSDMRNYELIKTTEEILIP